MLGEDGDGEDEGEAEEDGEANAGVAAGADGVDGVVAAGGVDEAAVGAQQLRLVGLKGEPALGAVGQRAVAVVGVVPVVEGGGVEVDAAEDGVGLVVAAGEGEQVAGVEDVELDDHCASRRGSAVVSGGRLSSSPERGCRAPSKGLAAPDVVQPRRLQPRRRNSAFSRTVMPMLVFTSGPRSTSPNQIGRWQGRGPQWGGLRDKEAVKREKIWKKRKRCDVGTNWIGTHGVRRTTDAEPAANRQWRTKYRKKYSKSDSANRVESARPQQQISGGLRQLSARALRKTQCGKSTYFVRSTSYLPPGSAPAAPARWRKATLV